MYNTFNPDYIGGSYAYLAAIVTNTLRDRIETGETVAAPYLTDRDAEALDAALLASTGCIDPPEDPEVQNSVLRTWIHHCRLPLGSTLANSKCARPFDPTAPGLLTVAPMSGR